MKKVLMCLLTVIICFTLTGCFTNQKEKLVKDIIETDKKEVEDTKEKATESKTTDDEEINLYSDNTKLVFEIGNIKHVFYYSGDNITAYHSYVEYDTKAQATTALAVAEKDDTIKKMYVKGKYIIIEFNESQYKDLTVSQGKTAYAYMKEVKENE